MVRVKSSRATLRLWDGKWSAGILRAWQRFERVTLGLATYKGVCYSSGSLTLVPMGQTALLPSSDSRTMPETKEEVP